MSRELVVPYTGELVDLDAPTNELARLVDEIRELESALREIKSSVSREVHSRMDRDARWTVEVGGYRVSGASPSRVTYDGDRRELVLVELVASGEISEAAAAAALEVQTIRKPRAVGINALRKISPSVAAAIDATATPVDPDSRRLTVVAL
jgi:hypothetical protein